MDNNDLIIWLQKWFESNCDGDWEHGDGITIENLDNPGWRVCINIEGTSVEDVVFEEFELERTEQDWVVCRVENMKFKGYGGASNLLEILEIFRSWVIANENVSIPLKRFAHATRTANS